MALKEYARKRHFDKTPEPSAQTVSDKPGRRFVVQKHAASRLHYDLRLEHAGVLKSWAVPKGPSLNPANKHLAIMVEDHPLDYIDFEGVIPTGEYGAGRVMVWDSGTYRWAGPEVSAAEQEAAMERGLAKGHLSVILAGAKLKGEFALVRAPRAGENAWLLIKARDDRASDQDVLANDKSVKSGLTLPEIGDPPLSDAPKAPLPDRVAPMLATLVTQPFDKEGWLFEIKYDGYRAIGQVADGRALLYSRAGHSLNDRLPALAKTLSALGHDAVIDGEVTVLDESGRPSFQLLQDYLRDGRGDLVYYVFDLLWLDGHDLTRLPLRRRKRVLRQILPEGPMLVVADHVEATGKAFFEAAKQAGLEGIVAKDGAGVYAPGERGRAWLKIKARLSQEFVIGGYTAPQGGRHGFGSLLVGAYKGADLIFAGHVGTGFDERALADLGARLAELTTDKCPFAREPKANAPVTWVRPELVAEVEFAEWTREGLLRQSSYLGLRDDKAPRGVIVESAVLPDTDAGAVLRRPKTESAGRLRLTNLNKPYWQDDGVTKGEMVEYYRAVARYILPHLAGRPESLHRFPNGLADAGFWQKNADENTPGWVRTVSIPAEDARKTVDYIVCDDTDTLLYLANLGCIEINPWLSRVGSLDRPDFAVIDLDPLDVEFSAVVKTGQAVHTVLREAGVKARCKTSGATGLHIFVPLGARYTYEQAREFAELVCVLTNKRLPEATSLAREPKDRRGRVYLDYLQNRRGATVAAPYSLRPHPGAPVSMPLDWTELKQGLDPADHNIRNAIARVKAKGDIWKSVEGPGIDMEVTLKNIKVLVEP